VIDETRLTIDTVDVPVEKVASRVRVTRRRQAERARRWNDPAALGEHNMDVLRRWLARGMARMARQAIPVDEPQVVLGETTDDLMRDGATYVVSVRALETEKVPPGYRDRRFRVKRSVTSVRFPVVDPQGLFVIDW
jgi:hypothetical protein